MKGSDPSTMVTDDNLIIRIESTCRKSRREKEEQKA